MDGGRGALHLWDGGSGHLGHGGPQTELVPRLVGAMAGKKVVGSTSGTNYTAVWTESGELSTFGYGVAGHGIDAHELSPRLVEALVGKVIGIGRSLSHSSMNGRSELFTFGQGSFGSLAHGGEENESVPRFVSAAPVSDCILHIAYYLDLELPEYYPGYYG